MKKIAANRNYRLLKKTLAWETDPDRGPKGVRPSALTGLGFAKAALKLAFAYIRLQYNEKLGDNIKYIDKYFHCLGSCEAVLEGLGGIYAAEFFGKAREEAPIVGDIARKGDSQIAVAADFFANNLGMASAYTHKDCGLCWEYIPNGTDSKHWVYPKNISYETVERRVAQNTSWNKRFMTLHGEHERVNIINRVQEALNSKGLLIKDVDREKLEEIHEKLKLIDGFVSDKRILDSINI